jgi:hypothetical protein
MKTKSNPSADEFTRFQDALRTVLKVSKTELVEREKQYQSERATKPKRGPKPKQAEPSASDHASDNED